MTSPHSSALQRVPLVREVLADLDTPLSTYLKLADGPYSYLFESVQGGERWGRYSIIGLPARSVLRVAGHDITLLRDGVVAEQHTVADPLAWIEAFQKRYQVGRLSKLNSTSLGGCFVNPSSSNLQFLTSSLQILEFNLQSPGADVDFI